MTTFAARPAIDPSTGGLIRDAVGQVYAEGDTTFSAPLAATDLAGAPLSTIRTTSIGTVPDFIVGDEVGPFTVVWKSGPYSFVIDSPAGILAAAEGAAQSASVSAQAAATSAAKAFRIGRPAATVPTWWGKFTTSTAPTAGEGAVEGDLGVLLP